MVHKLKKKKNKNKKIGGTKSGVTIFLHLSASMSVSVCLSVKALPIYTLQYTSLYLYNKTVQSLRTTTHTINLNHTKIIQRTNSNNNNKDTTITVLQTRLTIPINTFLAYFSCVVFSIAWVVRQRDLPGVLKISRSENK